MAQSENTSLGANSLLNLTGAGNDNTVIGTSALNSLTSGDRNIALGAFAGDQNSSGSDKTYIGNRSPGAESHTIRIGTATGLSGGGMTMLWSRVRSWLTSILRRSRMESEMDAELRFHLEAYAEDLARRGVPRQEAARRARLDFGGIDRARRSAATRSASPSPMPSRATCARARACCARIPV
jgi:hypothetical protein